MTVRRLKNGDEEMLAAFLKERANTTMHIRTNLQREGFAWEGKRCQGIYFGAFNERGELSGVLGYFWNRNILMQADEGLPELLEALAREELAIRGVLGPVDQVREAIELLAIPSDLMQINKDEDVYIVDLDKLVIPEALTRGDLTVRPVSYDDLELAVRWRVAFNIEALGAEDSEELRQEVLAEISEKIDEGNLNLLERDGVPVAMSGQDAALADSITVGPVWTPPEERNKGYARAIVAGSLLRAREEGGTRSILFTDNPAAAKAYEAVGYRHVDKYGLTLLKRPFSLAPI